MQSEYVKLVNREPRAMFGFHEELLACAALRPHCVVNLTMCGYCVTYTEVLPRHIFERTPCSLRIQIISTFVYHVFPQGPDPLVSQNRYQVRFFVCLLPRPHKLPTVIFNNQEGEKITAVRKYLMPSSGNGRKIMLHVQCLLPLACEIMRFKFSLVARYGTKS